MGVATIPSSGAGNEAARVHHASAVAAAAWPLCGAGAAAGNAWWVGFSRPWAAISEQIRGAPARPGEGLEGYWIYRGLRMLWWSIGGLRDITIGYRRWQQISSAGGLRCSFASTPRPSVLALKAATTRGFQSSSLLRGAYPVALGLVSQPRAALAGNLTGPSDIETPGGRVKVGCSYCTKSVPSRHRFCSTDQSD